MDVIESLTTVDPRKRPDETFEYIDVSSVSRNTFSIQETSTLLGRDAPSRARRLVHTGDVLFATIRPTLQRIAVVPDYLDGSVCSTGYFVLRPKTEVQSRFLFYYLFGQIFSDEMATLQRGASYPAVSDRDVKEHRFPLPPLPEQERIVSILDEAFAAIATATANAQKNLANAQELFETHLNTTFSQKGKGWVEKKIQDVCTEIFAGGDAPKDNYSKEKNEKFKIPIFANAVKNNGLYGFSDSARVTKPSVTIAARGSGTGHTELRNESFLPIVRLIVIIPDSSLITLEFLKYSVDSLEIMRSGSAIPQLTVPMIKKHLISLPALDEQKQIVQTLNALSAETKDLESLYQQKLDALAEFKQSLLHKAFTGELTAKSDKVLSRAGV